MTTSRERQKKEIEEISFLKNKMKCTKFQENTLPKLTQEEIAQIAYN